MVIGENLRPIDFGIEDNDKVMDVIKNTNCKHLAIEMVASYGMPVGVTVFETVFWIGRFWEQASINKNIRNLEKVYRKDIKMNICQSMRAKDSNIRQALIDRFGEVGTKDNPGWFYGFKKDLWSAYAVGVTMLDHKGWIKQEVV